MGVAESTLPPYAAAFAPKKPAAPKPAAPAPVDLSKLPVNLKPSLKKLATDAANAVRAYIKSNGKPPTVAVKAVRTYQAATEALDADGKWGPLTRARAARDMGVAESTLPPYAAAFKAAKPATPASPKPKPKPKPPSSGPSTPVPSAPSGGGATPLDPVWSGTDDPQLPTVGPTPTDPSTTTPPSNSKKLITLGLIYYLVTKRKRAA
jgi:hypothetical protein